MENQEKNQEVEQEVKKTTKKKTTKKTESKKKTKAQLKKVLQNAEVVVVNNFGVTIGYDNNNGFELELETYGDTDIVEVEELRKMHVKKKAFFNNYWILIIDIICDDETITLEDVYEYIGISKLYDTVKNPNEDFFNKLLLESSFNEFKNLIEKLNKALVNQLFIRATELYQQGKFRDSYKIMEIERLVGREDCFKDYKIGQ